MLVHATHDFSDGLFFGVGCARKIQVSVGTAQCILVSGWDERDGTVRVRFIYHPRYIRTYRHTWMVGGGVRNNEEP